MTSAKNKLFAVLALAFALRVTGIGFGLPHLYHQDEPIIVNHALSIGAGGWNTHFFVIPPFTIYFLFLVQGVYFAFGKIFGLFPTASDFAVAFFRDPSTVYLLGRVTLGALFGTATVWALWRGTKRFFGENTALWAALLLAVLPMHVQQSHYIYADIPLTLAVTLMFFGLLAILEDPSMGNYIRFGALAGWAASIKYTGLYFVPPLLLCHWLASGKQGLEWKNLRKLPVSGVCCIAVFLIIAPYTFLDWQSFWTQLSRQSGSLMRFSAEYPWWFHLKYSLLGGTGALFLALCLIGLSVLWRGSRAKFWTASSLILVYYGLNLYPGTQFFSRYMLPLTPVLALCAAIAVEDVRLSRRKPWMFFIVAALSLELLLPCAYSNALFLTKDTRTQCVEWFEGNVPSDSAVIVDSRFFGPHLTPSAGQLRQKAGEADDGLQKTRLDLMLRGLEGKKAHDVFLLSTAEQQAGSRFLFSRPFVDTDWESLKRTGARYLVVNYGDLSTKPGDPKDELSRFVNSISDRLELMRTFSPYHDASRKEPLDRPASTAAPHLVKELFSRRTLGPYLEVYRLKDA